MAAPPSHPKFDQICAAPCRPAQTCCSDELVLFAPVSCAPCHSLGLALTLAAPPAEPPECTALLPDAWRKAFRGQALRAQKPLPLLQDVQENTFVLADGRLSILCPKAEGKRAPRWNASCGAQPPRFQLYRQTPVFKQLRELALRGWLPDAVLKPQFRRCAHFLGSAYVPTISIQGYEADWRQSKVPIPTPHIMHDRLLPAAGSDGGGTGRGRLHGAGSSSFALERSAQAWWEEMADTLVYIGGYAWHSLVPFDPFMDGRTRVRDLTKQHAGVIRIPSHPIPFQEWARHKCARTPAYTPLARAPREYHPAAAFALLPLPPARRLKRRRALVRQQRAVGTLSPAPACRYTLYLDGVGPSDRMPILLGLNSTLFIPNPVRCLAWTMPLLQPYVHYLPVLRNLSDLVDQVRWARTHDGEARRRIAAAGAALVAHLTKREEILCATRASLASVGEVQQGIRVAAAAGCVHVCPLELRAQK